MAEVTEAKGGRITISANTKVGYHPAVITVWRNTIDGKFNIMRTVGSSTKLFVDKPLDVQVVRSFNE
jgi:hypothetical protein